MIKQKSRFCPLAVFREGDRAMAFIYPQDCTGGFFEGRAYPPCIMWSGLDCLLRTWLVANAPSHIDD